MLSQPAARPRASAPWVQSPLAAVGLACGVAALLGVLAAAIHPLAVLAALVGGAGLAAVLWRPVLGLFGLVAVVGTLPFGVIPVRIGVQFTFVDVMLMATFLAFALRLPAIGSRFRLGSQGVALVLFCCVAVAAFVVGSGVVATTPDIARRFLKLLVSLLLFVVALNLLRERAVLEHLARALMLAGALAGAVGTALWLLPPLTQLRLLTMLAPLGYRTDSVLRYVPGPNETYTNQIRATGTAVDPNVFGGTLLLAAALIVMQLLARERLFNRFVLLMLALPTLSGLLLSWSRGSWVGLAAGLLLVGTLRYRRIWLLLPLGLLAILATPVGQDAVGRFVSGFSAADPATALRLGEYRNALTLIQRYPLLGIGFGSSPDIDVTAGVSSVYLLVGEQTGLLGLALYVWALGATFIAGWVALRSAEDERLRGLLSGLVAAFGGALVAGTADHYFANQVFPHAVALFWLYAALLVAAARLVPRPAEGLDSPPLDWRTISSAGSRSDSTASPAASDRARRMADSPSCWAGWATLLRLGWR